MSIEAVKEYLKPFGVEARIREFDVSTATVEEAASACGVIPARICKTLSFKDPEGNCILIETAGDTKINNSKFKKQFGFKAKMLSPDEVIEYTGHAIGGVCGFAIENDRVKAYTDISLKRFETVFPACGTSNSAIELTCDELHQFSKAEAWIDVCKIPEEK